VKLLTCDRNGNFLAVTVETEIVITCASVDCSSPADVAATSTLATQIDAAQASIATAVDSAAFIDDIEAELVNLNQSAGSLGVCLTAYVTFQPTVTSAIVSTDKFYPNWEGNNPDICVQDGNEPIYMQRFPSLWMYDTLEKCCAHYYSWNLNTCQGSGGSGQFYADYANNKCVTDCEAGSGATCGGLANLQPEALFPSPLECCKSKFSWVKEDFCEAASLPNSCYEGTDLYYRGDTAGESVCAKDCAKDANGDLSCGGLVEDANLKLYDDAEECCAKEYGWMNGELCADRVHKATTGLAKYWADKTEGKCYLDSATPTKDLGVATFDTIEECCEEEVEWATAAQCGATSGSAAAGTGKYYVHWLDQKCARDCDDSSDPQCKLAASGDNEFFDSQSACCARLTWVAPADCMIS